MRNLVPLLAMLSLELSGCFLAHVSEEGAAVAAEGDVRASETLGGCSNLRTHLPVGDGCLLIDLFTCSWMATPGRVEPFDLWLESDTRTATRVRFSELSCTDSACIHAEALPVVRAASGWLRASESPAILNLAGDITFTAQDDVERRVVIREQDVATSFGCR